MGERVLLGNQVVELPAVDDGDRILPVFSHGQVLVIGADAQAAAKHAVDVAEAAFAKVSQAPAAAITRFFEAFADSIEDDDKWARVAAANQDDVSRAEAKGRPLGRLRLSDKMRAGMASGLRGWAQAPHRVGEVIETRHGDDFVIERRRAPLGIVAFIFEGRPNVFADGAGVIRGGNVAVMRIGSDAQGTAEAIADELLYPALEAADLPLGTVSLVRSRDRAAGQALFCDTRLRLAVARGSGTAVSTLGAIAEQHGINASLHGTGGAWMLATASAPAERLTAAMRHSLDRKVCNTLNTLVIERHMPVASLDAVKATLVELGAKVHVTRAAQALGFSGSPMEDDALSEEYEWDDAPELAVAVADDLPAACALCNRYSPRFVASLISGEASDFDTFYAQIEAPYVGDAFTRWVDGQWAWLRPELGILSGADLFSVREVFRDKGGVAAQRR